jgi:hypothetical protein
MIIAATKSKQPDREAWSRERLARERSIVLGLAIDKSTHLNYSSALNSYITFCRLHDFPIDPTPDTLSFYTVFMSHHIKPTSVDTYLSGICQQLEIYFPDVRNARRSVLVHRTLNGCKRLLGSPTGRKSALTHDHLLQVLARFGNSNDHNDKLFVAQIFTGFHALMRLGELCWPDNRALQSFEKISKRRTVKWPAGAYQFFLPGHKADKFFEGNQIVIQRSDTPTDPYKPFLTYLKSRDSLFPFNPELWLMDDGTVPTRSFFITRLRALFDTSIAGQSMRAGGATSLAEAGVSPHIIQAIGRWKSDTWQIYVRKNPVLIQAMIFGGKAIHEALPRTI